MMQNVLQKDLLPEFKNILEKALLALSLYPKGVSEGWSTYDDTAGYFVARRRSRARPLG